MFLFFFALIVLMSRLVDALTHEPSCLKPFRVDKVNEKKTLGGGTVHAERYGGMLFNTFFCFSGVTGCGINKRFSFTLEGDSK